jgi:hypothetical protein
MCQIFCPRAKTKTSSFLRWREYVSWAHTFHALIFYYIKHAIDLWPTTYGAWSWYCYSLALSFDIPIYCNQFAFYTLRSWVYDLYLKKVHLLLTSYHLQNVMHCRRFRLERQLASSQVPKEQQINLMKDLERKETEYMRLKRHKICVDDFELLTIIGRGAFGEVCKLNFIIYFSTCTYVLFMAVNFVSCTNFLCP